MPGAGRSGEHASENDRAGINKATSGQACNLACRAKKSVHVHQLERGASDEQKYRQAQQNDDALGAFVVEGTARITAARLQKLSDEHFNVMPTLNWGHVTSVAPVAPLRGITDA